jgi:hypothetical protein
MTKIQTRVVFGWFKNGLTLLFKGVYGVFRMVFYSLKIDYWAPIHVCLTPTFYSAQA